MPPTQTIPPYRVRVSARSKRVRLVVTPESGLTVVTPRGFDPGLVEDIVRGRLEWVTHHLGRALAAREADAWPPASVELRAVGRVLVVRYRAGAGAGVRARAGGPASLDVSGAIASRELVDASLRRWLLREAGGELPRLLFEQSDRLGLSFSSVTVRLQRTRWGSCSAKGGISLNARLLFLPSDLANYVLAHELAHTVHLDHSPAYWSFLEGLLPGARQLDRALRTARRYVPGWARG